MKMKEENKIALLSITVIYLIFTVVRLVFFPDQTLMWHVVTGAFGLAFILFFGYIVRAIDIYLDKVFPFEKNIVRRIMLQFIITLAVLFLLRLLGTVFIINKVHFHISRELWIASFALNVFMVLSVILSIFGYHFFKRWKEEKVLAAELEKEKATVQYDNLKNQLNPHFLFNSLSSLNSLIFENPQLASEFLQQLAKVYRYVLETKEKELVSVETEIKFVSQYVHLLKTRFDGGLEVTFEVKDEMLDKKIVPVTLQVLLENAIKHNITSSSSPLILRVYNEDDYLVVENNLQKKQVVETSNRQGLGNLKNLYRFVAPKPLLIEETERAFAVKVPLI